MSFIKTGQSAILHKLTSFNQVTYFLYDGDDGGSFTRHSLKGENTDEEDRLIIGHGMEKLSLMAVGDNWETSCKGLENMTHYKPVLKAVTFNC